MSYTLLIVDDSDTVREVLIRTINMAGLPVEEIIQAQNGEEALEKLKSSWVDIIFSDINMPKMNGIQFIKNVYNSPELKDIPVIVISTEGSLKRIDELKQMGISGYVRKPFTPEKIKDAIVETLGEW